jgi:hypothetical protein
VPTVGDNVTIQSSDIVTVNTNVQISDLIVQNTSVLKPDVGTRTITIDDDLSVANTAAVNYNNGTGTLNFVFTGSDDGTSAIDVASTATLQMNNVTFTGATVTADGGAGNSDSFTINGNLAVTTGSFIAAVDAQAGEGVVTMTNSTAKTITNAGALTFESLSISTGSSVTSSADFTVRENLSTASTSSLALSSPSTVTKSAAGTITNAGTLTFGSGTTLQISATTALAGADITNFAGTLNIAAAQLTAGTFAVSGTGNLTISGASTLSYQNTSGVAAVLNLTGTRSFPTTLSLIITGNSTTGFDYATGTDISTVDDITINASVTLSTTDSFVIGDDLTGAGTLNATAGTITFGTATVNAAAATGTGTYSFFNMTLGTGTTLTLGANITVTGSLNNAGVGLDFGGFDITMTGTGTLTLGTTTMIAGAQVIIVGSSANITLGANAALGANGNLTLTSGTLDASTFTITGTTTPYLTLTAGTFRTANTGGLVGTISGYAAGELSADADVSYDFYGTNGQTTLGLGFGAAITGDGSTTANFLNAMTNLTVSGSTTAASSPAITAMGLTAATLNVAGNISITGLASYDIAYSAANDLLTMSGTAKTIVVASTASASFNNLTVPGTVTTTSNFAVKGIINVAGSFIASSPSVIALPAGAAQVSPAGAGTKTFFDVAILGANNHTPAVDFTIAGNLLIHGTGTLVPTAGIVTMSGTSKYIYVNTGATAPSFFGLTVSGSLIVPAAGTSVSASGYTGLTTIASDISIIAGGTLTCSGSFTALSTASSTQTTTFAAAGTLAGAGTYVFKNLVATGAVAATATGSIYLHNTLSGAGTWNQSGTAILYVTNLDGAVSVTTFQPKNITIPSGTKLTQSVAAANTNNPNYIVTGYLALTGTGAIALGTSGNFTLNSSATFETNHASGVAGSFSAGAGSTGNWNTAADVVLTGATTSAGLGVAITNANFTGQPLATTIGSIGTLYINTAAVVSANEFQINEDFVVTSGSYAGTAGNVVTFAGTNNQIKNNATFGALIFATGSSITTGANITTLSTADPITVNGTGSFIATAGTVTLGATGAAATDGLTNTGTGTLKLFNLTVGNTFDAYIVANSRVEITNNLTMGNATSSLTGHESSTLTFSGTSGVITPAVDYTAGNGIALGSVIFSGTKTQTGNFIVEHLGEWFEVTASGNFTPGTGTVNLNRATSSTVTIINAGTLAFNNLTTGATAANSIVTASSFAINGNFTVQSADGFLATAGEISIGGAASQLTVGAISAVGTGAPASLLGMNFNSLRVKSTATGATTSGAFAITHRGDITVEASGSLVYATNSSASFWNGSTKAITNAGTLTFEDFIVDNASNCNVETASSFNIADDMTVGGALGGRFTATAGTVNFTGANSNIDNDNSLNGAQSITFNGLSFTGATPTFDATAEGDEIFVKGDLTFANATSFIAGNGTGNSRIWLNGTGEQTISVGVGTVDLENLTVNNSNGAKLVSTNTNITAGQLTIDKTLRLQSGDLDLNGNNIVEIDATAGLLSETPGNTVKNNGVSTSTGYIYQTIAGGSALVASNIGGLGAQVTTDAPGATTVKRYHIARTVGASVGISRYFEISSTNANTNINFTFRYDESELNGNSEASLELVRSSTASGPWTHVELSSRDAANNFVRESPIAQFTGINSFYTLAVPSLVELSSLSLGVETSPLTAGTAAKAIGGVRLTSTGAVTVNTVRFDFSRTLAGSEFTNFKLYSSNDNDYSTSSDNSLVTTTVAGGSSSDNTVTFTLTDNNSLSNGSPRNYFIVADVNSAVTAATSAITAGTTTFTGITVTDGVVKEGGVAGTAFTFLPAIMMEENFKGLSNTPLVAGSTNNAIAGFIIQGTSSATFGGFTLATSADAQNIFENIKVYSSTDNDYSTTGDNVLLTSSVSASSTGFAITLTSAQTAITTPRYFFVVAGVKNSVDASASEITTSIAHSSFVSGAAGKRFTKVDGTTAQTTIAGRTYAFSRATATLASANMPAAGNISRNISNQTVYGFSITPDNANTVGFTGITFNVSMSGGMSTTDITSWRLHADANNNGWADAGEQISIGSLSGGQLSFASFSTAQNLTSLRRYIVTANVASNATIAGTVSLSLLNRDYVTITSPTTLNTFSAISGNTQTVRNPGTATNLVIVGNNYSSPITTGGTVSLTVQARDASGYPANVTSAETVTLSAVNATLASNTAVIASGANYVSITPTLTLASGTTSERLSVSGSALTSTAVATGIKILVAEPTTQASDIDLGTLTATTAPISGYTVGNGANRIIVVREGLPPVAPTDGTSYTAVTNLKNATAGSQTGPGSFVVLNTTGGTSAFTVLGLTPNRTYFFQAYEFNGTNGSGLENYNVAASWTSASVQNPVSGNTPDGSLGTINTTLTAAAIATDVNVSGAVTAATDTLYYQFVINSGRNNFMTKLSSMPKNYTLELYDVTAGVSNAVLIRKSEVTSTGNDIAIYNNATAGNYLIKIFGADANQFSSTNYTLRVTTSASEILSQPAQ